MTAADADMAAEVMRGALEAVAEAPTPEARFARLCELGALIDDLCADLADLAQRCEHLDAV